MSALHSGFQSLPIPGEGGGDDSIMGGGLTRDSGIRVAVTTVSGSNRAGVDPLQLQRLDSGYCRAPSGFDAALFEAELLGWFHPLRGR